MARGDGNPNQVFERALAALNAGDLDRAAREARKLAKIAPTAADAWSLRAAIAGRMGQHGDARKFLGRALQLKPGDPALLNNLGNACAELGDHADAVAYYEKSLVGRPGHVDTLMNLGNVLMELRYADAAAARFEEVLRRSPGNAGARINLGSAHMLARRYAEALALFEGLLADGNDNVEVWTSIYNAQVALGRLDAADRTLERLMKLAPDNPKVLVHVAILHLLRERWADGWRAYAARWLWKPGEARPFKQPWWNGEVLTGRKVLAWGEQGLGDEIMFAAMIPDLAATAGSVLLECDQRLLSIFQRSFPAVDCVARANPPAPETRAGDIDYQVPTGNLGIWFRANAQSFGDGTPFLKADLARSEALAAKYRGGTDMPLIGIAWKSFNPDIGDLKSMRLEVLAPILATPGVQFFNLQYGETEEERVAFRQASGVEILHDPDIEATRDIDGHAAQIAAMDLVISISNTAVHLAGALGVETWCLIQNIADRRWLANRADSPWYRSLRLYRQRGLADWRGPVADAAADLGEWVAKR